MKREKKAPPENLEAEIAGLIATLHDTERRLVELTGGEVDTVSTGSGQPFLLRRAQEELRAGEAVRQAAILNALPAHVALLDADGVIVSVNDAWRQFATANHLQGPAFGIGVNYLTLCDQARGGNSSEAHGAAAGIRSVLDGAKSFSLEYPCHSPTERRWFQMTGAPLSHASSHGVVVMHVNITERKLAENVQRESQTTMAAAQHIGHFGSWEVDLHAKDAEEMNTLRWSDEMFRIAGYEPGAVEITNRFFFSRVPPAEHAPIRQAVAAAMQDRKQYSFVHHLIRADETVCLLQETAQIYYDEKTGQPVKIIGTAHDITERAKAEAALRESNEKFHQLADNITDAFWIRSPDFSEVQYVSPAFEKIWGRTVNSLQANPQAWGEFIFSEDRARVAAAFRNLTSTSPTLDIEYRIVRPDGEIRWVRVRGSQIRNAADQLIRHIGIVTDITERKQINLALLESERHFRALFDQAAVGVAQADVTTGRFFQVNQRFADILGRTRDELEHLTFTAITHPLDLAYDGEKIRQLKAGSIREYAREKRYLRKDGAYVWVSLTVSAMWAPGETPGLCIAVVQDISERKRLDEHFLQAQKMEALGQFSGGVAHDFNNILATISGYTELSRMILQDNPDVDQYLEAVLQASGRAADLVKQILTFSRQQPQERLTIQLRPIVEESVKLLRATIPSTIGFDTDIAADAPPVFANANQIHQVLMNLGVNAWHAMKDRPGRLRIVLEKWAVDVEQAAAQPRLRPGAYARVSVGDTGSGMDAATLRRIFEPFFTTKPVGEGTGLGLAVVHGIMDTHDGAITVDSTPGEGTVFQLYFPAHAGEVAAGMTDEGPIPHGHGEAVLVVDDEEMIASVLQQTLTKLGYAAESATDPATALALVQADPPRFHLVLSDQTMPGMTGLALAARLRAIRPDLPVILMTGFSLALTPEGLASAGVCQVLFKPLPVHLLGSAVHAALAAQPPP